MSWMPTEKTRPNSHNNNDDDWLPSWSPDGQRIAFESDRDGDSEIYVMDADGKNQTQLTNNNDDDGQPSWSPDGQRIAFVSDRDGDWRSMSWMPTEKTRPNSHNNNDGDWRPSWSPDGQRIAFDSDRDGDFEIYVMDADGKNITQLTNNNDDDLGIRLGRPTANASHSRLTATETLRSMSWMPTEKTRPNSQTTTTTTGVRRGSPSWLTHRIRKPCSDA